MKSSAAVCFGLALSLTAFCGSADAQSFWGDYRASTPAEGAAYGMASVVRAAGQYQLDSARAATEIEVAQDKYLDNRMKATQTFFEMRKMNREYRKEARGPALTYEQMYRLAQVTRPKELDSAQLDPVTGDITWPPYLRDKKYDELRNEIDAMFVKRSQDGVLAGEDYVKTMKLTEDLLDKLRDNIKDLTPSVFVDSKKFIESLQRMARASA